MASDQGSSRFAEALQRVQALVDPVDVKTTVADVLLIFEYFRRVAALAEDCPDWADGPFFDPEAVAQQGLRVDADLRRSLDQLGSRSDISNGRVRAISRDYVIWSGLADQGSFLARKHVNVFEPLLKLFERGHDFGFHHGELVLRGGQALPLGRWRASASRIALDMSDEALASLEPKE